MTSEATDDTDYSSSLSLFPCICFGHSHLSTFPEGFRFQNTQPAQVWERWTKLKLCWKGTRKPRVDCEHHALAKNKTKPKKHQQKETNKQKKKSVLNSTEPRPTHRANLYSSHWGVVTLWLTLGNYRVKTNCQVTGLICIMAGKLFLPSFSPCKNCVCHYTDKQGFISLFKDTLPVKGLDSPVN